MTCIRNKDFAGKQYKKLFKLSDVTSDKVLHQKACGMYELTQHRNILEYAIKSVSHHEMDKPFSSYVNWN